MIDLLIVILMSLGLSFGQTESGQISLDSDSMAKLQSSEKYQAEIGKGALNDGIIIVPDVDPVAVK
ncbi:MAG: hypothetical protein IPP51_02350 [Bacteroidetes bacterium]|nr:hypothetical protein [Bacteroidota bacterium]